MSTVEEELASVETAYRRAVFRMIGLGVFVGGCCFGAVVVRKMFCLQPALLSIVFIAALLLFSPDIFRFMVLRNKVQRLRAENSSS
jgi:hypothetical protein